MKLNEPDLDQPADEADAVIRTLLPRFHARELDPDDGTAYAAALSQIQAARSKAQNHSLDSELNKTPWVLAVDAGSGRRQFVKPHVVCIPTDEILSLFAAVPGVWLADREVECYWNGYIAWLNSTKLCSYDKLTWKCTWQRLNIEELGEIRRAAGAFDAKDGRAQG
jgi:hypothetical protein